MAFQIPLHISRELRPEDRLKNQKRAAAQLAVLMASLNPRGFRQPRKNDPNDLSFTERRCLTAGMIKPKKPKVPDPAEAAAEAAYKEAVRMNRTPSLTNYEQGRWYASGHGLNRLRPRKEFVGCRFAV